MALIQSDMLRQQSDLHGRRVLARVGMFEPVQGRRGLLLEGSLLRTMPHHMPCHSKVVRDFGLIRLLS